MRLVCGLTEPCAAQNEDFAQTTHIKNLQYVAQM